MNIQDIHDIGADGPRAYAPFTPTQLQDAHDWAKGGQEPEGEPTEEVCECQQCGEQWDASAFIEGLVVDGKVEECGECWRQGL